jgi:uncharacterized protein YndB with AHSA1/START domain
MIERTIDAPVDLVWRMWTEAEHFAAWYGPTGARVPVATMDVRVGGGRHIGMEMDTPDGPMRMWFVGEYREVDAPHRLVYTEAVADEDGNVLGPEQTGMPAHHPVTTEVTVVLHDVDGRTRMVLTHAGVPADSPGATGWRMAFDKLDAHVVAVAG